MVQSLVRYLLLVADERPAEDLQEALRKIQDLAGERLLNYVCARLLEERPQLRGRLGLQDG